jgi:hypothetical protein
MDNDKYLSSAEWAKVYARAWQDPEFKSLLERDPAAAVRECGIEGKHVFQVDPRPGDLDDTQLSRMASGDEELHPRMSC